MALRSDRPYSALHTLSVKGVEDFVKWSNETDYIKGIKLIVDIYDTGMDVGKAVAAFNMGLAKDPRPVMTTGGVATPTCLAIKPLSRREKIPCIDGASSRPLIVPLHGL